MKNKKVILIIALVLVAIGGISFGIVRQQNAKAEQITQQKKKEAKKIKENQQDPYKNLSKVKAEKVSKLDGEVAKLVGQKKAVKPLDNLKNAEAALKELESQDADLKSVHEAYASVINTVKTPDLDTLQDARTAIANMDDTEISDHMADEFEDKLINIVSVAKLTDKEKVDEATKPLTPQQAQAKKEKKAKEAKDAEAKAKADAEREKKEQAANEAAREAAKKKEQEAANNSNSITGTEAPNGHEMEPGGYETPADNGYTPPVDNGYTPPANNGGGASNNNAAQDAANNVQTPTPPKGDTITGTEAPNGHEMEPGGW